MDWMVASVWAATSPGAMTFPFESIAAFPERKKIPPPPAPGEYGPMATESPEEITVLGMVSS
jgi:hypothetical protein